MSSAQRRFATALWMLSACVIGLLLMQTGFRTL